MQPLDIPLKKLVGETGVEPAASWSRTKRATRLRYSPIVLNHTRFFLKCPDVTIDFH